MKDRSTVAGVLIPLVGLVAWVGRAEVRARTGPVWRFEIQRYEPRYPSHGHYLQYRYVFEWSEHPGTCGPDRILDASCCLCLTGAGGPPRVRQVFCEAARMCDGWIRSAAVTPPRRYLVPEDKARWLEQAMWTRKAEVDVTAPSGGVAVGMLYLDGVPWPDAAVKAAADSGNASSSPSSEEAVGERNAPAQ